MRTTSELSNLSDLYRQAAMRTAAGSKSFYFATRFFPPDLARAAHSVYWFCRYTDDLVDECADRSAGRHALDTWARLVERAFSTGEISHHPVLRLFMLAARRYCIPAEYPMDLIAGMRMDLDGTTYASFDELRLFCYRVASVVGLMMCHVIGFENAEAREHALPHAISLGIAMQLTNILRDIGEDLGRGRIYLPRDEMSRFEYGERDLRARLRNDRFRALMRFQVERAQRFYTHGNAGIGMLSREGRFAVKIASDVYQGILGRIVRLDFDVFARRAVVPAVRKYWVTARNITGPLLRRSAARLSPAGAK